MLEFATLFLGLVWGSQPVEMVVGDPRVAKLEFRLDGERAALREGPPWRAELDLGPLAPRLLEVVALGAGGEELGRAAQWVNLPRPQADARLVVEQDRRGRPTHGRLTWASVLGSQPQKISIRLDDKPLAAPDPRRFALPVARRDEVHFLSAELYFPNGLRAHAETAFGGPHADQVDSQLTAYLVRQLAASASLETLRSCFKGSDGKPLTVAAVERGAAELLVVRDRGAEGLLSRLRQAEIAGADAPPAAAATPLIDGPDLFQVRRFDMKLEKEDRVRLVWPFLRARIADEQADHALFDTSPILMADLGGLFFFLTQIYPADAEGEQRLADAVALAGLRAAAEGRRRAVLLVLGEESEEDPSALLPEQAMAYLEHLQVPLFVWSGEPGDSGKPEGSGGGDGWPQGAPAGTLPAIESSFRQLEAALGAQVVVWLAGRHLPAEVLFDAQRCTAFAAVF